METKMPVITLKQLPIIEEHAQIVWAINELGLHDHFRCTVSPMECTYLPTGQKVLFFGMDDPGKVKSVKMPFGYIGIAWFEELDQFDGAEQIRNVEQSCLRGGNWSITFKSFNPPAMARNWANGYALQPRKGKLVHHSTYKTTPAEWLGERFLADAEYLQRTNETAYRHEYLGEVVGSGTAVFENLKIQPITDEQLKTFDRIKRGVDWGWYPDPWAYNAMHYDAARRTLYIFDELTRRRRMTDWDIVKDIVVLAGLIITVTTPLLKLNTSITQLKALLDSVAKQVQENDKSNSASHKRLWEHNEEQDETLQRHEQRLHDLDGK